MAKHLQEERQPSQQAIILFKAPASSVCLCSCRANLAFQSASSVAVAPWGSSGCNSPGKVHTEAKPSIPDFERHGKIKNCSTHVDGQTKL
uniref:Uncharacterized protein n=1 Tax=Aegilops tauschii subsp. strangulata TaxID=200361 RepID=A0A453H3S3_AEGTS